MNHLETPVTMQTVIAVGLGQAGAETLNFQQT